MKKPMQNYQPVTKGMIAIRNMIYEIGSKLQVVSYRQYIVSQI